MTRFWFQLTRLCKVHFHKLNSRKFNKKFGNAIRTFIEKIEEFAFDNTSFDSKFQNPVKQKIKNYKTEIANLQKRVTLNNKFNPTGNLNKNNEDNLLLHENYVLSESVKRLNNAQELTMNIGNELERNKHTMVKSLSNVL